MLLMSASPVANYHPKPPQIFSLVLCIYFLFMGLATAQNNVLKYLELRDIGATPAEIILSPDFQTIIEFEGMNVEDVSTGRADQITAEIAGETVRLRANGETVNTDLTVMVAGRTALFILRSDPASNTPRRYVVRNSPPPSPQGLGFQGIEGKVDLDAVELGTRELPPGVSLNLTARMDNKGDVTMQYTLTNDGDVAIVNEPSRLNLLNEDIKLKFALSRVPPAGSVNVIRPGQSESGTIVLTNPPNGTLTFLWILVQLGPGGQYAAMVDVSELLNAPAGTTATIGTPALNAITAPDAETAPATTQATAASAPEATSQAAAPAPQGSGVTLYTDTDFKGASMVLPANGPISFYRAAKGEFGAVSDNAVSSLSVPEGYSVLLCDLEATFPCQQYGPGSHNVSADLNDKFSFAQVTTVPVQVASQAAASQVSAAAQPATPTEAAQTVEAPANAVLSETFEPGYKPWELWNDPNATGKASIVDKDGYACVNIENNGAELWSVQLVSPQNLTLEAGRAYSLSFNAKADMVSQVAVNVGESVEPFKSFHYNELSVDAADQPFTYTFTVSEGRNNIRVVFMMGGRLNTGPKTVCVDNVILQDVTAGTASPQEEASLQGQTTQASAEPPAGGSSLAAGTYALAAAHSGLCADVPRFSNEDGAAPVQWNCNSEENQAWRLEPDGEYYRLVAAHSSKCLDVSDVSVDDGAVIYQWTCVDNQPNQLWSLKQVSSGYQLVASHSGKCAAVADASAEPGAGFVQWACSPGDQASNDVFALNAVAVSAEAAPAAEPQAQESSGGQTGNLLVNSSFEEASVDSWNAVLDNGAKGLSKINNGEYCFNVVAGGQDLWNVRLNQGGFAMEPGQPYVLRFEAYANKARTVKAYMGYDYEPYSAYFMTHFDFGTSKQPYALSFVMPDGADPTSFVAFHMGGDLATNTPFQTCFDNVTLEKGTLTPEEATTVNTGVILGNGTFENDLAALWKTEVFADKGGDARGEVRNGEYCITVTAGGSERWAVRGEQDYLSLESGSYTLSFDAYASQPYTMLARIGQNYEPWHSFNEQTYELSTQKQTFTLPLSLSANESNGTAEFWVGGDFAASVPAQICLDNIKLQVQ
jgi:hypothetical protein